MSVKKFENKRWCNSEQTEETKHKFSLDLICGKKVIDIGCGKGIFMEMLRNNGMECVGVDISDVAIEICKKKNLNVILHDIEDENLPFKDNEFDTAVLIDVLEHLLDPERILREASRVANQIVVSVPNFNSLPARLQVIFGKVPENNTPKKGHVYWFNYNNLNKLVDSCGLKIVKIRINTYWENKFLLGHILKILKKKYPSLFALMFVVLLEKK